MIDPAPITNEATKAFFRESFDVVNADDDRSWRTPARCSQVLLAHLQQPGIHSSARPSIGSAC